MAERTIMLSELIEHLQSLKNEYGDGSVYTLKSLSSPIDALYPENIYVDEDGDTIIWSGE